MQLVEQHIIKSNNPFYKECDQLCFKTKNLYNSCLYTIRQEYILNNNNILWNLHHLMKDTEQYKDLPAKVSSTVLNMVQINFKSFFAALKSYDSNPRKFNSRPRIPGYLDKIDGRFFASYTNQAISPKIFRLKHVVKLSKTNIELNTKITNFELINCVRVIPNNGYYTIEIIYTTPVKPMLEDNNMYLGIDLGVSNLAVLTSNVKGLNPVKVNGRPLKSINQFYNKKLADIKSVLKQRNDKYKSKKINKLNLKRKNKVDNYLHNSSKQIVNYCIENQINTIVVGKNDGWKQDSEMSKQNNQNFISIPHSRFIDMLKYKCEIEGIKVITKNESYTSKCSFLDSEFPQKQSIYAGKRIKRGMFRTSKGILINADVNGSYNIILKAFPKAFVNGIEGVGVHPSDLKSAK